MPGQSTPARGSGDPDRFLTHTVDDESCLPTLKPGDVVVVERGGAWGDQDLVLAEVDGELVVRRAAPLAADGPGEVGRAPPVLPPAPALLSALGGGAGIHRPGRGHRRPAAGPARGRRGAPRPAPPTVPGHPSAGLRRPRTSSAPARRIDRNDPPTGR